MAMRCKETLPDCKYVDTEHCILTKHHTYWQSTYKTQLDIIFGNLPQNIEILPRCEHDKLHENEDPPDLPNREQMLGAVVLAIANEEVYLSNNKVRRLGI